MKPNLTVFNDPDELANKVSDWLMEQIAKSPGSRFDLAISGGSTPNLFFKALASKYAESALWQKTHFWWVDERMVEPGDPESNFGTAQRLLFQKIDLPKDNIHRIKGEAQPEEEVEDYSQQIKCTLRMVNGRPVFDLVLLGIGDDGHTASIFPNQTELLISNRICAIAHHPVTNQLRITLTGGVINSAAKICFLVTGAGKAERLSEIFSNAENARQLPAALIIPLEGELWWYVDKTAASLLKP